MSFYRPYPKPRKSLKRRVLEKTISVDTGFSSPCIIWQGEKDKYGYGRVKRNGRRIPVHWVLKGDPPEGLEADHLCFQRDCINPDHIEFVTRQENLRRRKGYRPEGEL